MKKFITILVSTILNVFLSHAQVNLFGRSEINVSVSRLGEAKSELAIYSSPGRLGIKPQISISITSENFKGILGKGGSINGLSCISRTGSNFHLNGKQEAIKFVSDDELQMDGNRLILVSGVKGMAGAIYRTSSDNFSRIEFTGTQFKVDLKNGGTSFYGSGNNSSFSPSGSPLPLAYYLFRTYDKQGNFMEYHYEIINNQILISSIEYSGFDPTIFGTRTSSGSIEPPFNKMQFIYENSNESSVNYISGYLKNSNKRLIAIESYTKPNSGVITSPRKIRNYVFSYKSPCSLDILTGIQEFNENGESYEPIIFDWTEDGNNVVFNTDNFTRTLTFGINYSEISKTYRYGNFTGKGEKEILTCYPICIPNAPTFKTFDGEFRISTITKNHWNPTAKGYLSLDLFNGKFSEGYDNNCDFTDIIIGDLDCDGDDDVLIQKVLYNKHLNTTVSPGQWDLNKATIHYYACLSEFNETTKLISFKGVPDYFAPINMDFPIVYMNGNPYELTYIKYLRIFSHLNDFDGDGRLDLLTEARKSNLVGLNLDLSQSTSEFYLHKGNARGQYNTLPTSISNQHKPLSVGDFNGNGKSDLFIITGSNSFEIKEYNGVDFQTLNTLNIGNSSYEQHKFADFNGDGNTDLLLQTLDVNLSPNYYNWIQYISNGNAGFVLNNNVYGHNSNIKFQGNNTNEIGEVVGAISDPNSVLHLGDVNGDGMDDVFLFSEYLTFGERKVMLSTGLGFINKSIVIDWDQFAKELKLVGMGGLVDVFGKGNSVLLGQLSRPITFDFLNYSLNKINNNQFEYSFEFKYLTDNNCNFSKTSEVLPNNIMRVIIPQKIVQQLEEKHYGEIYQTTKYFYKDLLYNRHGFGLLGYRQVANSNSRTNITQIEERRVNAMELGILQPKYFRKYRSSILTGKFPDGGLLESEKYSYFKTLYPIATNFNLSFAFLSYEIYKDHLREIQQEICYDYDLYGNLKLIKERTARFSALSNPEFVKEVSYAYGMFNSWIPSTLITESLVQLRVIPGSGKKPPYKKTTNYTINSNGFVEYVREFEAFPSLFVLKGNTYDKYGNILSNYLKNINSTGPERVITFEYSNGRFLTNTTNSIGEIKSTIYEEVYGNLISETTGFSKTKYFSYDFWGKKINELDWWGNFMDYDYSLVSLLIPNGPIMICRKISSISSLGNSEEKYIDMNGNLILFQRTFISKNGQPAWQSQRYNYYNNGLLKDVSNWFDPGNEGGTINWTRNAYDVFDRILSVSKIGVKDDLSVFSYENTNVTESSFVTSGTANSDIYRTTIKRFGVTGEIEEINDQGQLINYILGSHNKPLEIISADDVIELTYNNRLETIEKKSTTSGTETYTYLPYGEINTSVDQNGNATSFVYNIKGLLTNKNINSNCSYKYYYFSDPSLASIGLLQKEEYYESSTLKHAIANTYNSYGQLSSKEENIIGQGVYLTSLNYDLYGRLLEEIYPNISLRNYYDATNVLIEKKYNVSSTTWLPLWKLNSVLHDGKVTQTELGNGIVNDFSYNSVDWALNSINISKSGNSISNYIISRDLQLSAGNIRGLTTNGILETFEYDQMDRLIKYSTITNIQTSTPVDRLFQFKSNGSLTNKFDAGNFEYENKPYSPSATIYSQNDIPVLVNQSMSESQAITYNHLNKVINLIQNDKELNIDYGVLGQRIHSNVKVNSSTVYDAYYVKTSNTEIVNGNEITYLYVGDQPVALYNSTTSNLSYLHLDIMGSLTAITDQSGTVLERRMYDPWGRPRNPDTYEYILTSPFGTASSNYTLRGFTFHEHLDWFDLINMNGRMFDTHLSQFLNADPIVSDYSNSQSFNRYSYVTNNPLENIDPTGYIQVNLNSGLSGTEASYGYVPSSAANWNAQLNNNQFPGITIGEVMGESFFMCNTLIVGFTPKPTITPMYSGVAMSKNNYIFNADVIVSAKRPSLAAYLFKANYGLARDGVYVPYYQINWSVDAQGGGGGIGTANTWNGGVGVLAGAVENLSGGSSIGTNGKLYSSGWGGNQYVSTAKVAKVGKILGYGTLALGAAFDGYGVYNYYTNGANSPNAVHPGKAGLNLGVGVWGLMNPATATGAALYYGIDTFYPGGFNGAMQNNASLIQQNQAILVPGWNLYRDH